jgi:DTW domain-containing protein YfiP
MSRILCQHCQRPSKACICNFIVPICNTIKVVLLQHPNEVNHTKGTATLLTKSLKKCQVIIGEDFSDNNELKMVLDNYQPLLLYPSENAKVLPIENTVKRTTDKNSPNDKEYCLIILDGTWKKAYRMLMLSTSLQQIPAVTLPDSLANSGQYLIRKVAKNNALSSLEACCYALSLLEDNNVEGDSLKRYEPLLNNFVQFNEFQLSFRPSC